VHEFIADLRTRLHSRRPTCWAGSKTAGQLSDEDEKELGGAIADFVDDFGADFDEKGDPVEAGESDRVNVS